MSKRFKLGIYASFTLEKFFIRESSDNIVIFELFRIFFRFYTNLIEFKNFISYDKV